MNDEKLNTAVVPYLSNNQAQREPEPLALVNEFSSGYVNKTFNTASRVSDAVGVTSAFKQAGLTQYSDKWNSDTTKNLLSAIAILMLLSKFKNDGLPFLMKNWKPVGAGMVALAYLLHISKQKDEEQKSLVASQSKSVSFGVRG